ncbi:MAG: response regulator [Magnetococcales bacterium]|nr:response regulator [Magnetococcales bacterium]
MIDFIATGMDRSQAYAGQYDPVLVTLSLFAAFLGCFSSLSTIDHLRNREWSFQRGGWLLFGALALGIGTFLMHFIGMLAYSLPVDVRYAAGLTAFSALPGVLAAGWMLNLVGEKQEQDQRLWLGGLIVGAGVGLMHYMGMAAMQLQADMRYDPTLFALSILVAVGLANLAIQARSLARKLGLNPDAGPGRLLSPLIMSMAISGMHYTAMSATWFFPGCPDPLQPASWLDMKRLEMGLAVLFFGLILLALLAFHLGQERVESGKKLQHLCSVFARENRSLFLRNAGLVLLVILLGAWILGALHDTMDKGKQEVSTIRDGVPEAPHGDLVSWHGLRDHPLFAVILGCALLSGFFLSWGVTLTILTRRRIEASRAEVLRELEFQKLALDEHAIVSATDVRGNIIYANDKFVAISGYSREELLGSNHRMVKSGEHSREFYRELWSTIAQGRTWHGEVMNLSRDGTPYWVRATIVPFLDEKGKPFRYVSIRTDVTAMKALEASLIQAKAQAEAAASAKSEFLANMSHEIRTPMNAIIGLSHLCLQTTLTVRQKDYIRKVHNSATSLLRIINDILDYSKIEAGRLDMESIDFTLEEVLGNLSSLMAMKAQEKRLEFLMETAVDIPPSLVGDPLRLGQVLLNLTNNAIKFTSAGEILLVTRVLERLEEAVRLEFSVRDSGIGMTEAQISGLFQAFTQADASVTRKYGGTGLGLTISKRLIDLMGGSIRVESTPGEGSRFVFDVWLGVSNRHMQASLVSSARMHGRRVLVVDDYESARKVMEVYLTSFGLRVSQAEEAAGAMAILQEGERAGDPFDLVVTDYMMPETDGITLATRIRHESGLKASPRIMIVTAFGEDRVIKRASRQAGIDHVLVKPVSQSLLLDAVMEIFGHAGSRESVNAGPERPDPDGVRARLSGARILLVEDNEINRQVARELLEMANVTVSVARNGQEALDSVVRERPDGVLMDVQMPVMDGLTATRRIREQAGLADLPILAMTANAMRGDRERCLEAGMQDHIAKPVDPEAMYATLARWIKPATPQPLPELREGGAALSESSAPLSLVIPGVDTRAGLRRMRGNLDGYVGLVSRFLANQRGVALSIRHALAGADLATAERLAHTLKGVAATIGANELADKASRVESAIRAGGERAGIEPLLEEISQALEGLYVVMEPLIAAREVVGAPEVAAGEKRSGCDARHLGLLRDLDRQLEMFDAEADVTLAILRKECATSGYGEWLTRLAGQIGKYDFDAARHTLGEMVRQLNPHPGEGDE